MAICTFVAFSLSACSGGEQETVASGGRSSDSNESKPPELGDQRDIGTSDDDIVGSYSERERNARNVRIAERLYGSEALLGGSKGSPSPETKAKMIDALEVLDPVEIHDDGGRLVAYLGNTIIPIEDYPAARAAAEETVERLRVQN